MYDSLFYAVFRRRGAFETLRLLYSIPGRELIQKAFFAQLTEENLYPNLFFRARGYLLKYHLIAYHLDNRQNRVVRLTKKGELVWEKILNLGKLFH
jgi:hypothetical protein